MKCSVGVESLKGTKHKLNEDRYRMLGKDIPAVRDQDRGELFGVFDGIGSAPKGRQAAQEMADIMLQFYLSPDDYEISPNGVSRMLMKGNKRIFDWGVMEGRDAPLGGCAGTIVWINGDTLYSFHAGDTLAIHVRDGSSSQITRSHQASDGAIFRYFGLGPTLEIESNSVTLEDLDRILLVSDGITKVMHPKEAVAIIEESYDISLATKTLAHRAQNLGSSDDITVMLIEVEESD
ncbi:MAG: protein serine/threonine phosphatase 2C family protein [Deltaproteobacteria bacterium]|nr:protein serine/threonine phosphatase 2C family protein [Deltaproteobacteria bacterium]